MWKVAKVRISNPSKPLDEVSSYRPINPPACIIETPRKYFIKSIQANKRGGNFDPCLINSDSDYTIDEVHRITTIIENYKQYSVYSNT